MATAATGVSVCSCRDLLWVTIVPLPRESFCSRGGLLRPAPAQSLAQVSAAGLDSGCVCVLGFSSCLCCQTPPSFQTQLAYHLPLLPHRHPLPLLLLLPHDSVSNAAWLELVIFQTSKILPFLQSLPPSFLNLRLLIVVVCPWVIVLNVAPIFNESG